MPARDTSLTRRFFYDHAYRRFSPIHEFLPLPPYISRKICLSGPYNLFSVSRVLRVAILSPYQPANMVYPPNRDLAEQVSEVRAASSPRPMDALLCVPLLAPVDPYPGGIFSRSSIPANMRSVFYTHYSAAFETRQSMVA